jgi:hypothetical protein
MVFFLHTSRARSRSRNCGLNPRISHMRNTSNTTTKARLDPPIVPHYAVRNSGDGVGCVTSVGFGTSRFGARGRDDMGWSTSGCTVQNLCGNASVSGRGDGVGCVTSVGFGTPRFGARGRDDVGWSTSGSTVQNLCGNASTSR